MCIRDRFGQTQSGSLLLWHPEVVIDFFTEAFEPTFMQRALLGALIAVVATSVVGTWVVLRGLSFLGDALAHGVIPGIALAVLWGFSPIIGAFVAAIIMSGLVTAVSARTIVREDTAIGLLFVGMLALGIVIVSRARAFTTCLLYTSPSPRDATLSRMPSSA